VPHLSNTSLKDISVRFSKTDEFFFYSYQDGMLSFICENDLTYKLTFFPSPFARLETPFRIDDLLAAIDETKHFELQLFF
jgi:hypothetical protein